MVGAPDVDQLVGVLRLLIMIGEVGAEIGPAPVRFLDRPVLIVAEFGRAEQRQFNRLPILGRLALRRFEHTVIDQAMLAQPFFGGGGLALGLQLGLRREEIMMDAQLGEVGADHVHHRAHRLGAEQAEPRAFGRADIAVAIFGGELFSDGLQIIAGVEPLGNRADIFAQRLAVAHVDRAREHIDLRTGVVDIIFARDLVPRIFEQRRQRVAHHRAAAMADVHWAGRVRRHIFDIDAPRGAHRRAAIVARLGMDQRQFVAPAIVRDAQVDEARPGNARFGHFADRRQFGDEQFGKGARARPCGLGEHHCGVGRNIAMRRVARRFDADRAAIEPGGQRLARDKRIQSGIDMGGKTAEQGHGSGQSSVKRSVGALPQLGRHEKPRVARMAAQGEPDANGAHGRAAATPIVGRYIRAVPGSAESRRAVRSSRAAPRRVPRGCSAGRSRRRHRPRGACG